MSAEKRSIRIFGSNVEEEALRGALKDITQKRGLKATLIVEKENSQEELHELTADGGGYANVYKYAFF